LRLAANIDAIAMRPVFGSIINKIAGKIGFGVRLPRYRQTIRHSRNNAQQQNSKRDDLHNGFFSLKTQSARQKF
jgi:hypothetical protein